MVNEAAGVLRVAPEPDVNLLLLGDATERVG